MNINKSIIPGLLLCGILIGSAMIMSAFTEPTVGPNSMTSYPPVNVGNLKQVRTGSLGIGDGTDKAPTNLTEPNSLYFSTVLGLDSLNVTQNATLVGNVAVGGRMIVAGALRAPELLIPRSGLLGSTSVEDYADKIKTRGYGDYYGSMYEYYATLNFPKDTTSNLGKGKMCTTDANKGCPIGWIVSKYNSSTGVTTCRSINPSTSTAVTACPKPYNLYFTTHPYLVSTTNNTPTNCQATRRFTAGYASATEGMSGGVAGEQILDLNNIYNYSSQDKNNRQYWEKKVVGGTEWTFVGLGGVPSLGPSGDTKYIDVVVPMSASSTKLYDLRLKLVPVDANLVRISDPIAVYSVVGAGC